MNKVFVVSVMDSAVGAFSRPFFVPTTASAVRSFSDEVNRQAPDNPMFSHPSDYVLYSLGMFDEASGKFENLDMPEVLVRGKDVVRSQS